MGDLIELHQTSKMGKSKKPSLELREKSINLKSISPPRRIPNAEVRSREYLKPAEVDAD